MGKTSMPSALSPEGQVGAVVLVQKLCKDDTQEPRHSQAGDATIRLALSHTALLPTALTGVGKAPAL